MTALDILHKYWKHADFRKSQAAIINDVLLKKNVVALLPTGGGKSICYQIPTLLSKGVCIVISPLIALMQDQVNSLEKKNIKAVALTSKLTESEIVIAFDNMRYGKIQFLYLSPEKLQSEFIQQKIQQLEVSLIAVDEAHCISEWGHDFRPSYLKINILKELLPNTPFIAVTATATKKVVNDIITLLSLNKPIIYKDTFQRENLAYQVFETEDVYHKLKRILTKINQPSIIYVNTRKRTKDVSDYLNSLGYKSTFYHGGLAATNKDLHFKKWMTEQVNIMVATNAFGMGIDKDNVKVVIHIEIPNSLENYVQEAGRAGRNGKKAFSVILYNQSTIFDFNKRINNGITQIETIKQVYNYLNQHLFISKGELPLNKFSFNLQDFCAKYKLNIFKTFNAIQVLEKEDVLVYEESFNKISSIKFKSNNEYTLNYTSKKNQYKELIQLLLRSYGGIFENRTPINETYLAKKLHKTKSDIKSQLLQIEKDNIIEYIYQSNNTEIQFLMMREDNITINSISKNIKQRNSIKLKKASTILNFIENNKACRNKQLLAYFDEKTPKTCGICDVCLDSKHSKNNLTTAIEQILSKLDDNQELSSKELVILLNINEAELITSIRLLLEQNKIILTKTNKYKKSIK